MTEFRAVPPPRINPHAETKLHPLENVSLCATEALTGDLAVTKPKHNPGDAQYTGTHVQMSI